jgi:hypothetical protein
MLNSALSVLTSGTDERMKNVALPELHVDAKSTRTCCGVTVEPFHASARSKSGDTIYVTAYECPRCMKIAI